MSSHATRSNVWLSLFAFFGINLVNNRPTDRRRCRHAVATFMMPLILRALLTDNPSVTVGHQYIAPKYTLRAPAESAHDFRP